MYSWSLVAEHIATSIIPFVYDSMVHFPDIVEPTSGRANGFTRPENAQFLYQGYVQQGSHDLEPELGREKSTQETLDNFVEADDLHNYLDNSGCGLYPLDEESAGHGSKICSSYPFESIVTRMVKWNMEIYQVESHCEGNQTIPISYNIAFEILNEIRCIDKQEYFTKFFDFLEHQLLCGIRLHEESQFSQIAGPLTKERTSMVSSPVLAWLEDSIIQVVQHTLTTHFISADVASAARQLWLSMPSIWKSKNILPQRVYLRDKEIIHSVPNAFFESSLESLLSLVCEYDASHCDATFSHDVRSIPGYADMIPYPISLVDMVKMRTEKRYETAQQLFYDLQLMLLNCAMYNPPSTAYYNHAKAMFGQLFTWMVHNNTQYCSASGSPFFIDFEEHIVNSCIALRQGDLASFISLKAAPMRDSEAFQSVKFFTALYREFERFQYLNLHFELPKVNSSNTDYLTSTSQLCFDKTVSLSHNANVFIRRIFSCIQHIARYALLPCQDGRADGAYDLSFLNIEGFKFDPHVVEQHPVIRHRYLCVLTNTDESRADHAQLLQRIVHSALLCFARGEMLLHTEPRLNTSV